MLKSIVAGWTLPFSSAETLCRSVASLLTFRRFVSLRQLPGVSCRSRIGISVYPIMLYEVKAGR